MTTKKILLLAFLILIILGITFGWRWYKALTASSYQELLEALYVDSVPRLQVEELKDLEEFTVLDTRLEQEYQVSHLQGAQWVNYQAPDWEALEQLDKTKPLLVYCSVGYRSERIGEQLLDKGFTEVYNLHGGIFAWVNAGKTVVAQEGQAVQAVHGYAPRWGKWVTAPVEVHYHQSPK